MKYSLQDITPKHRENYKKDGNIFDKKKVYNRLSADTSDYVALDQFGISTGLSGLIQYFINNDDNVDNKIKVAKDNIRKVKEGKVPAIGKLSSNERSKIIWSSANNILGLEDAKDIYLGLPQRSNTFKKADKSPEFGKLSNAYKSTYLSTDKDVMENYLLPAYNNLLKTNVKGGDVTDKDYKNGDLISIGKSGRNGVAMLPILGRATIGQGIDKHKGPYVSYYDKWDVTLSGNSNSDDNVVSKAVGGKPFDIYDRIYLDDYYGINTKQELGDYYGGYLPEVIVKPNKNKRHGK